MTTASHEERFAATIRKAEAEALAYVAEREGADVGLVTAIRTNALQWPGLIRTLRKPPFSFDGLDLARAMADPDSLIDAIDRDANDPEGWNKPLVWDVPF